MPISLSELIDQLRTQYPTQDANQATSASALRKSWEEPSSNKSIKDYLPKPADFILPGLSSLFGGGGDSKPDNPYDKYIDWQNNPFNQSGIPNFDPLSGYFQGLDTGGDTLNEPKAYKPSKTETDLKTVTRGLIRNLPSLLSTMNAQILPNELAQLQSSSLVSPYYAQMQRDIQGQNAMAAAQSDKDILLGPGADVISIADKLQRQIDPEYYSTRTNTSNAIGELMKPGLTGGERSEVERSLNKANLQAGTHNVPTNTSTVANAMTYGGAARDRLSSAVNQATQFLPLAKSGVDVLQQGIKSPSSVSGAFSNVRQNSGQDVIGAGNNIFGSTNSNAGQLSNTALSNQGQLKIAKLGQPAGWEKIAGAIPDY